MIKYFILFLLLFSNICLAKPSSDLLDALAVVESNNIETKYNHKEKACGKWQLRPIYIKDVNRIFKTDFKIIDAFNPVKARSIVTLYLTYWGKQYEKKTGKEVTDEVYSKIHNGGPNGWKKESTEKYWKKVKEVLYDKKRNNNKHLQQL